MRIPLVRHATPMVDPARQWRPGSPGRTATGWDPGHERLARPYVIGVTQDGWKPPTPIVDRVDRATRALITDAPGGPGLPHVIAVGPVGDSADEPVRLPSSLQAVAVTGRGPVVTEPLVPGPLVPAPLVPEPLLPEAGTGR